GVDHKLLEPWLAGKTFAEVHKQFDRDGYIIFEKVMDDAEVQRYRDALAPWLGKNIQGRNNFEGYHTNRVYALLAKEPVFANMVTHPLALAFAEADLGTTCLLSALLAINLQPGETVQPWHHDDGNIFIPTPRESFGVSAFWTLDDTTAENGATEIVPGSHKVSHAALAETMASVYQTGSRDPGADLHARSDAIKAVMPRGSLMLCKGTLLHRGGANRSNKARMIVTPQYCPGWARQLENMIAAVPPEAAAKLPERTRQLIGYSIHGSFMGYVDGRHPQHLLS
ncbi:MAG: phytanoyl-CoA dioxygenase family protein, partial [Pseudomonadales bacterium]